MKIALLPLYIKLYDEYSPASRPRLERFYADVAARLAALNGDEILTAPFCRVQEEFRSAVAGFEERGADVLVTLHMAYSPSLESSAVLAATPLPIVVLDTTPTYTFTFDTPPQEIMYNHGIHGVMDMCNLLRRNGKPYAIVAGGSADDKVLRECREMCCAAVAARSLAGTRVGAVGGDFVGMGGFAVSDEELLDRFGVTRVRPEAGELPALRASVTDAEIDAELAEEKKDCIRLNEIDDAVWRNSIRDNLAVRKWIARRGLSAYTVNFGGVNKHENISTPAFREACKEMAAGIGYAGEGDALTAALTGALIRGFGDASFVEIFCPDWGGGKVFLSHMGEMNDRLRAGKVEFQQSEFLYGPAEDPVTGYACYRPGKAVFLNVFRDAEGYCLFLEPVEMLAEEGEGFRGRIRGWMKPERHDTAGFLKAVSNVGATHHSMLVYDVSVEAIRYFGELLGLRIVN